MCLYLFEMKQMPRKHPLFSLLIAICLTWNNKKQKNAQGPPGLASSPGATPSISTAKVSGQPSGPFPPWLERGTTSISQLQAVANLELRRHVESLCQRRLFCQMKTEAHSGSYAQRWPKERYRNYPKYTEISRGPKNLMGNDIGVWAHVPRREIKSPAQVLFSIWGRDRKEACCIRAVFYDHFIISSIFTLEISISVYVRYF